ncbi:MAG: hypothetical protein AUG49_23190 [Catenulispora sp. 13_1_20CM_3_70_7]|nr:MAG: hypothetical protein AUG49_23190 [Catenulispora sp. 13_1_20CM_3_70_7]
MVTDTQEVVTTGGSVCQTFLDAEDVLSTKYGTTVEVDRLLTKAAENHVIQASVLVLPSAGKALAVISDLTAGLKGCKTLTVTQPEGQATRSPSAIPQLMRDGQVGYIEYMTVGGKTVLTAVEMVHVGAAVSVVALAGPVTNDTTTLERMGATLVHLSDIQVERLKAAQSLG